MLVLQRTAGSRIIINDNIEVTVVKIRGKSVVLGITAPPDVRVMRDDARKGSGPKDRAVTD
jgi:carbon storage regulator